MIEQFYLIQSGPESNRVKGVLYIPQTLGLKPHH